MVKIVIENDASSKEDVDGLGRGMKIAFHYTRLYVEDKWKTYVLLRRILYGAGRCFRNQTWRITVALSGIKNLLSTSG